MQGFFQTDSGPSDSDDLTKKGNKKKGPKGYVPQKNSVAYALLITLFREIEKGNEFMHKKHLIDAAETSGLSRVPIAPEKAKGKAGHFGSSPRDWYTGWNCMKTLITKGLVVKSSCPAKYMLTEEGKKVAHECLSRSGMVGPNMGLNELERCSNLAQRDKLGVNMQEGLPDLECVMGVSIGKAATSNLKKAKVTKPSQGNDISSLRPAVPCHRREDEIYGSSSIPKSRMDDHYRASSTFHLTDGRAGTNSCEMQRHANDASSNTNSLLLHNFGWNSGSFKSCSANNIQEKVTSQLGIQGSETKPNSLAIPPLAFGETFGDMFMKSRSRKIIENICSQYHIQIEVRRLPVGDCIWIARNKYLGNEYVLDFIVERKKIDDLRHSIRDNRYRDQKMRLVRCGLKKMIYLVEGDPNSSEAAESIKTACFTTEILEGFDVQRTNGLADTFKKYGHLTQSINEYYRSLDPEKFSGGCPPFDEFIKRCEELDKMTVSDVFGIQLMQVPRVTEEIALAVLDIYPTLSSLACAYSLLEGDVSAQEEMLRRKSNNLISGSASKNIFQLVWGG